MAALNIKPQAVQRIKSLLNDSLYKEAVEHSASYNTRLCIERKMRLPFLDAQTGVAQNNCYLWMHKRNRMPGEKPGQVYTYPSKRWRKRRRQYLANFLRPRMRDYDPCHDSESNSTNLMENSLKSHGDDDGDRLAEDSKDSWFRDYDEMPDPPDAGELDDPESDFDDYEESYSSKRKKKKGPPRGKKRSMGFDPATEAEKLYQCDICGARYKTRPGLSYHYSHSHINSSDANDEDSLVSASPKSSSTMSATTTTANDSITEYQPPPKGKKIF